MLPPETDRSVLITGAASGIGRATVEELSGDPNLRPIYATDINPAIHTIFAHDRYTNIITVELDVRRPNQVAQVVDRVMEETGNVGILLNVAGVMSRGRVSTYFDGHRLAPEYVDMWETNIMGPLLLINAVRPYMRKEGSGLIVNTTSTKYLKPEPFGDVYGQLKLLLSGITAQLTQKEKAYGIKVVDVQPGYTNTAIDQGKWTEKSDVFEKYLWQREMTLWKMFFAQNPRKVAEAIHQVITGKINDDVVVVGLESRIPYFLYRHFSGWTRLFRAYADYCIGKAVEERVIADVTLTKMMELVDTYNQWKVDHFH